MMQGLKDLAASERGIFAIVLVITVTVLAILRVVSGADWLAYTKWIAIALIASKTLTTTMQRVVEAKAPNT